MSRQCPSPCSFEHLLTRKGERHALRIHLKVSEQANRSYPLEHTCSRRRQHSSPTFSLAPWWCRFTPIRCPTGSCTVSQPFGFESLPA